MPTPEPKKKKDRADNRQIRALYYRSTHQMILGTVDELVGSAPFLGTVAELFKANPNIATINVNWKNGLSDIIVVDVDSFPAQKSTEKRPKGNRKNKEIPGQGKLMNLEEE